MRKIEPLRGQALRLAVWLFVRAHDARARLSMTIYGHFADRADRSTVHEALKCLRRDGWLVCSGANRHALWQLGPEAPAGHSLPEGYVPPVDNNDAELPPPERTRRLRVLRAQVLGKPAPPPEPEPTHNSVWQWAAQGGGPLP